MRVILDTNLWRYIAEAGAGDDLLRASVKGGNQVVVVPAVVYETLATSDEDLRRCILALLARRNWTRTMPEAFLESRELLAEIKRSRPNWLCESPDLAEYKFQLADWKRDRPQAPTPNKRGFWGRLRTDAEFMSAASEFPLLERARADSKAARDMVAQQGSPKFPPLSEVYYAPKFRSGAQGPVAEGWRWSGCFAWRVLLTTPGSPHEAWSLPFLRGRPWEDETDWQKFWLEDATANAMPRTWLRWASEYLQQGQKWSPGTPGDAQLSSHLVDGELFLSADKRLVAAFTQIADQGIIPTAKPLKARGGPEGVDDVISALSRGSL